MSSGFHSCSIACFLCTLLPSQTSVMVCADSPRLLYCFGKAVLKLPLSKKESLRRQDVFTANISFFCLYKIGRSGQCNHLFESKSLDHQDFHDHSGYLVGFFMHSPSLKRLTAIRCLMQLTALLKGEELRLEEKEQIRECSFN